MSGRPELDRRRRDIREYEAARIIGDLVGDAPRILNIGPSWGRDYYALSRPNRVIINLDIASQHGLPSSVTADASRALPLPAKSFDVVLLPEVLEHLVEDWVALREARRVLRDSGKLVVTVPFYHDRPEYHVRVHSPRSILRLIKSAGFAPIRTIYRGGLIRFPRVVHGLRKVFRVVGYDSALYEAVLAFDRRLGSQRWATRLANGVYILAQKDEVLDVRRVNVAEFADS